VIATVRNALSVKGISPIWPALAILFVVSPLLAPAAAIDTAATG